MFWNWLCIADDRSLMTKWARRPLAAI